MESNVATIAITVSFVDDDITLINNPLVDDSLGQYKTDLSKVI
jgi:hypothetical protein